jgi:hypothetical protein
MTAAPREPALRFIGRLLDRAVHDTFRRLWPLAIPFVIDDFLGAASPALSWFLIDPLLALAENRLQAVFIRSLADSCGGQIAWAAAVRYPRSLWFTLVTPLAYLQFLAVGVMLIVPAWAATMAWMRLIDPVRYLLVIAGSVGLEACLALLVGAVVLVELAVIAGMMDVVADGARAWPAFRRWIRVGFRRRTIVTSLFAGVVFVVLTSGCSELLSLAAEAFHWFRPIIAIPAGIADTLGFMFVWHWRNAMLDREFGRDLNSALDARATETSAPA